MISLRSLARLSLALTLGACGAPLPDEDAALPSSTITPPAATAPAADTDLAACRARIAAVQAQPAQPGAPAFDEHRPEFLGRARGEPMVFVREPQATPDESLTPALLASRRTFDRGQPGLRVSGLKARHRRDPAALRALVLREGYAYAPDPLDALAIVTDITLADLFAEPEIWLQRGSDTRRLTREAKRNEVVYRYVDGPLAGRAADLLFGDRVALTAEDLATPLHRDLRALADVEGFDRTRLTHRTDGALLADLRFGSTWVPAVLTAHGAALELSCLAADEPTREAVRAAREADGPRRRALLSMHDVITEELIEGLRFDRPEGEKTAERDGELRPVWLSAYLRGQQSFEHDGTTYPVFDSAGRAWPPQVCVDFVLDSFERTSGTWFAPRGDKLQRIRGRLNFDDAGIQNRRGVMAFGAFAESKSELFEFRRFIGKERIEFRERSRYFAFLTDHADEVRPGDVVAIHGMKRDNRIHQHAILVEWADPITGFPHGLADQMKRPRRRTWEGIMAEAPLRSLYYRVRPREVVFTKLDPG
ncbi:MAG: hypothetical protein QM820_13225 [Minicystis sp.]